MRALPTPFKHDVLKVAWIDTPLGPMVYIADNDGLYLLEFVDRRALKREVERLRNKTKTAILPGETPITQSIHQEITEYFEEKRFDFETPLHLIGSPFQIQVWKTLKQIPPGETRSYLEIASAIQSPNAFRAVARANGSNQIAIVIPCHRVINANGELGGYGGGLHRKRWLIEHEKRQGFGKHT